MGSSSALPGRTGGRARGDRPERAELRVVSLADLDPPPVRGWRTLGRTEDARAHEYAKRRLSLGGCRFESCRPCISLEAGNPHGESGFIFLLLTRSPSAGEAKEQ